MRSLTPEEAELWAKVAATIRPLSRDPISSSPTGEGGPREVVDGVRSAAPRPLRPRSPGIPSPQGQDLKRATLDSGWDQRLRSGAVEPDRVLDLHGHSLDQAWRAIDAALERAIAAKERVLLLITGHARPGDQAVGRGKIRAAVFDWLAASPHAGSIAAVRPASSRHGGAGSLYIVLRRAR